MKSCRALETVCSYWLGFENAAWVLEKKIDFSRLIAYSKILLRLRFIEANNCYLSKQSLPSKKLFFKCTLHIFILPNKFCLFLEKSLDGTATWNGTCPLTVWLRFRTATPRHLANRMKQWRYSNRSTRTSRHRSHLMSSRKKWKSVHRRLMKISWWQAQPWHWKNKLCTNTTGKMLIVARTKNKINLTWRKILLLCRQGPAICC